MTMYDYFLQEKMTFAQGVNIMNNYPIASLGITKSAAENLNNIARKRKPTEAERGKLYIALRKIPYEVSEKPAPEPPKQNPIPIPVPIQQPAPTPDDFRAHPLFQQAKELHKRQSYVHALMVNATTDEDRAQHAIELMETITPQLDALYDRMRNPEPTTAYTFKYEVQGYDQNEPAADLKKLLSLRTRISKLNKIIPEAKSLERRKELEAELAAKIAEKERIEATK